MFLNLFTSIYFIKKCSGNHFNLFERMYTLIDITAASFACYPHKPGVLTSCCIRFHVTYAIEQLSV